MFGISLALGSAAVWGAGDFAGGLAVRRSNQLHVLTLSALSGIVLLVASAMLRGEPFPSREVLTWAIFAGLSGTVGLACLYRGLSLGNAAMVAPIAAVITAALPVAFTLVTEGRPSLLQLVGFAVAMAGIWLVASSASLDISAPGFKLAVVAGLGFGGFLILIAQVPAGLVFSPLAVTRVVMLVATVVLLLSRGMGLPSVMSNPIAFLAGLCDASGNILYLLAREYTRLDVAAVLSSLYPVTTVLLSHLILKEDISGAQWAGMGVCLLAVALITLA